MLHVPGMPEGVHVSFSPEDQPVSAPAQPTPYTPPAPEGAGTPSAALTALLDAHELAYGHALCSEVYGLPDLAERRQAEEEAFRALLHTPMHSDADRVAYAIAVISRQMHSLGDASATERDHPMAVAYRNLRFGEHVREPEAMRHVGRVAEPETAATVDREALALVDALEREWAAEIVGDREDRTDLSAEADARGDARMERRHVLLAAAEALPAGSREARHAKALAFAWDASIMLWQADRTRDQYGTDGRLMVDLMDSLTGEASSPASSSAVVPATPTAADPHVALVPALRQAYAWTRDAQPIVGESTMSSPEDRAADAVMHHCWDMANRILSLPAPTMPAGLGAVALAMAVWTEGFIGFGPESYNEERRTASAIRAIMSVAGVTPMPEWSGFGDEPDTKARWDAMMKRAGRGSLPAWALAGKTGPDDEEIATGEEVADETGTGREPPAEAATADVQKAAGSAAATLDLSVCSVPQLARLHEAFHAAYDHLSALGQLPCFWDGNEPASRQKFNPAGRIIDQEADRLAEVWGACANEIAQREARSERDSDEILTTRLLFEVACEGRIRDAALMRDIATAWGA